MNYDFLLYTATALYMSCYIPIIYADITNKNANIYNIPERFISLIGGGFGLTYSIKTDNMPLIINYTLAFQKRQENPMQMSHQASQGHCQAPSECILKQTVCR